MAGGVEGRHRRGRRAGVARMSFPNHRGRRLRRTASLRGIVREARLSPDMLVAPLFICEGEGVRAPIGSLSGRARLSVDLAAREVAELYALGIRSVLLFGIPETKDAAGTSA